jgi:hypothetical protein
MYYGTALVKGQGHSITYSKNCNGRPLWSATTCDSRLSNEGKDAFSTLKDLRYYHYGQRGVSSIQIQVTNITKARIDYK